MMMNTDYINRRRMYRAKHMAKDFYPRFNCWGATAYVLELRDNLTWLRDNEMEELLECNTRPIKRPTKPGDILVITDGFQLIHTAIYLSRGRYFHKKGAWQSEYLSKDAILATYGRTYTQIKYRRINHD